MWDYMNLVGGTIWSNTTGAPSMRESMSKGLRDAGYPSMADLVDKSDRAKQGTFNLVPATESDFPSDYGNSLCGRHMILDNYDYPFSAPEVATRVLNALSFRTDLSAHDLYTSGLSGKYPVVNGMVTAFEPPTAFISDATFRHFAKDSVYGAGKDNSRIDKLIDFYTKGIFGYGKGSITVTGDPNGAGMISSIDIDTFGTINDLETLELVNGQGKTIASANASSFNSRIGFKDELVSSKWTKTLTKKVNRIHLAGNFKDMGMGYFQLFGKDKNGDPVDISSLSVSPMRDAKNDPWKDRTGLTVDGNHFYVNLTQ